MMDKEQIRCKEIQECKTNKNTLQRELYLKVFLYQKALVRTFNTSLFFYCNNLCESTKLMHKTLGLKKSDIQRFGKLKTFDTHLRIKIPTPTQHGFLT